MTTTTRRGLDREILRLAVPAFGALVAEPLYVLADTAVVGRLGTSSLDGLALAVQPLLIGQAIFIFLAYGTTAAVGRLLGAGEEREAADQAVQSLWLATAIGIVFVGLGQLIAGPLIDAWGGELADDDEIRSQALTYLRISLFGFPGLLIMMAGVGYLRGLQDTVRPLIVSLVTAVINLVIELVLIYGFDQGIGASALSTVIAQMIGAAAYVGWTIQAVRRHGVALGPNRTRMGRLASAGFDLFLRTIALRGSITFATAVAARIGSAELAAHQIVFEIWSLLALALDSIAIAGQAIVARYLGAGDTAEARRVANRMLQWGVGAGVIGGLIVLGVRPFLPAIFSTDEAVRSVAAMLAIHLAFQQPVNGVVFALDGILIGAGDLAYLARAMWIAAIGFVPLAVIVLVADLGIGWLWAAIAVFMTIRMITLLIRFRQDRWLVGGRAQPG